MVSVKLPIEQAGMSTNMLTIGNLTPKKLARYRMRNEISFNQAAQASIECAQALCAGSDFVFVCNSRSYSRYLALESVPPIRSHVQRLELTFLLRPYLVVSVMCLVEQQLPGKSFSLDFARAQAR
jgi:hypothetical protein